MSLMKKVSVIRLNYNGQKHLETYLPSVIKNTPIHLADIIVADNASTDNSVQWLRETYSAIKVIELHSNYGFAEGYNISIGRVETPYVILLNSDVEVTPNWIQPMLNFMEEHQNVIAVQPKVLQYKDKTKFEYAGGAGGFIDKFGYPFCRGRLFSSIEEDKGQYNDERQIFWASGACMMVRRVDFVDYGGLDENFFTHQEEIDFCWRVNSRGRKVFYIPSSVVYHLGGGTLDQSNPKKTYYNFRNNLLMIYKNLNTSRLIPLAIIRLFLDYLAAFVFLISFKPSLAWAVVKARIDFYRYKGKVKVQRKENLIKTIRYTMPTVVYNGSILLAHYLLRRKKFSQLSSLNKA
jgi:GT2 family glycosyltransferase